MRSLSKSRSSQRLEDLESRNLLVIPLDHHREWYRYHQLFRDLLSAELRRREPRAFRSSTGGQRRGSRRSDMPETAIEHAQAAGDADHVA